MFRRASRLVTASARLFGTKAKAPSALHRVTLFAGDGIGPEIATAVMDIFEVGSARGGHSALGWPVPTCPLCVAPLCRKPRFP